MDAKLNDVCNQSYIYLTSKQLITACNQSAQAINRTSMQDVVEPIESEPPQVDYPPLTGVPPHSISEHQQIEEAKEIIGDLPPNPIFAAVKSIGIAGLIKGGMKATAMVFGVSTIYVDCAVTTIGLTVMAYEKQLVKRGWPKPPVSSGPIIAAGMIGPLIDTSYSVYTSLVGLMKTASIPPVDRTENVKLSKYENEHMRNLFAKAKVQPTPHKNLGTLYIKPEQEKVDRYSTWLGYGTTAVTGILATVSLSVIQKIVYSGVFFH